MKQHRQWWTAQSAPHIWCSMCTQNTSPELLSPPNFFGPASFISPIFFDPNYVLFRIFASPNSFQSELSWSTLTPANQAPWRHGRCHGHTSLKWRDWCLRFDASIAESSEWLPELVSRHWLGQLQYSIQFRHAPMLDRSCSLHVTHLQASSTCLRCWLGRRAPTVAIWEPLGFVFLLLFSFWL